MVVDLSDSKVLLFLISGLALGGVVGLIVGKLVDKVLPRHWLGKIGDIALGITGYWIGVFVSSLVGRKPNVVEILLSYALMGSALLVVLGHLGLRTLRELYSRRAANQ